MNFKTSDWWYSVCLCLKSVDSYWWRKITNLQFDLKQRWNSLVVPSLSPWLSKTVFSFSFADLTFFIWRRVRGETADLTLRVKDSERVLFSLSFGLFLEFRTCTFFFTVFIGSKKVKNMWEYFLSWRFMSLFSFFKWMYGALFTEYWM